MVGSLRLAASPMRLARDSIVVAMSTKSRPYFGSLVLAVRDGDGWRYDGHVGAGFSRAALEELHGASFRRCAQTHRPSTSRRASRTKPQPPGLSPSFVAEVKFAE